MLGSDVRWLAGVAELADFKEARLSLWADGDYTFAGCQASHNAGLRCTPGTTTFNVSVIAAQFQALSKAFSPDENVSLDLQGNRLVLAGKDHALRLAADIDRPRAVQLPALPNPLRLDMASLKAEVDLASDFVSDHNPALRCLKLVNMPEALGILAIDSGTGGLLATSLPLPQGNPMAKDTPEMLIYPNDILQGLKVVGDGEIAVGSIGMRLGISKSLAAYQCSQVDGRWPEVINRFMQYQDYRSVVRLDGGVLERIVDTAKELRSSGIRILATAQGVRMFTLNTEWGDYDTLASTDTGDFDISYSLRHFQRAAKLGEEVELAVPNSLNNPARLRSGRRTYWIARMQQ